MRKSTVIKRLEKAIDILENKIKDEEFRYSSFVSDFDYEHNCGTVCCLAGWYPKYVPESGLRWNKKNEIYDTLVSKTKSWETIDIDKDLSNYHGLSLAAINFVFYGTDLWGSLTKKILETEHGLSSNRHQLADNIRALIGVIKEGKQDKYLLI